MITKITAEGTQILDDDKWQFSLGAYGSLSHPPIVAGDRLVCFTDSLVFALDIYTGEEVTGDSGFPHYLAVSDDPPLPTHSRGTLYFIESGELVARQLCDGTVPTQLSDGSERWKKPPVTQATSVNANESVVVLSERNPGTTVKGFNAITGDKLWGPVQVSQKSPGPVAATDDALVFVSGGHLFGVNIRSGDTRFDFSPAGDTPDPLTLDQTPEVGEVGDKTVAVTTGMAAYGVDISNGKQIWVKHATHPTRSTQWLVPAISERFNCVVLANNDGEIFVLELTTGNPRWSTQVANTSQVSIAGDKVYVKAQGGAQFTVYELLTGKQSCIVKLDDVGHIHVVAGHGILFTAGNDSIQGIPFSNQNAALFSKSHEALITVEPKVEQGKKSNLDFGQGDFTVEAWIATTCGGEIISGFPTLADDKYHGFRINVTPQGRIRFSVINRTAANSFASISPNTDVADGYWHHVAVVRHNDAVEMYLDGVSLEVDNARKGVAALDIGGNNVLTFGAFVPGQRSQAQSFFNGLIREMRIWDIALDASKLQSRMACTLVGKEPHMLGYWRMDETDITKLINHVPRHQYTANVDKVISRATELALDKSAFPYLLDQVDLQWPYAGHWSAHGEESVTTSSALDRSGVLSFGAGNMLYGVNAADGARFWGVETPEGTSAPVAGNGLFYVVTGAKGLISIDPNTGEIGEVKGFGGLQPGRPPAGTSLSAPAINDRYVAAATPKGDVWVVETPKDPTAAIEPWKWNTHDGAPGDLALAGGRVYLVAGQTLYQLNPSTKTSQSIPVANKYFHAQDDLVFCVPSAGKLVALTTSDFKKQKAAFNVPDGANVTGLIAAPDADLLVVATDKGVLYGLTYATLATRWTKNIPAGKATASKSLNVPTISGRTVFCTSASGAAAAVDARTGEFQSLFFEPTQITTPPLVDAGTIYFGCADAPPEAMLEDGALHSVVFGATHVLRLNVDYNGERETANGYASVTAGDVLELLGVDSCCVETWINTREGGEVLSIYPNDKYGLRLWLEKNGAIHFTCIDKPEDTGEHWQRITLAAGATPACDGRWHHVAVSRTGRKEATIYLDGVPVNATTKFEEAVTAPAPFKGLKLFIGADSSATAPANFFAGMIGEIRVWDTYLTATRIAERMHNKLIGNEPDLIAYWNFDLLSIHDGSRNGHDGKLETGGGSSGFWLADLNFTHPSYPYLETEGRIIQEGEEGGTGPLADTIFELVVTARKAYGGVLGSHDITLWYVRHPGEAGPDTITINSPKGTTKLQPVGPNHGDEQSVTATTGSNGKLTFRITTSQYGHGPAIDLRAAFLPSNERYHVSVLIDTQKLEKPAPPHLEAQSKLIQDYHWQTGDKWDPQDEQRNERRNRATWRAVITARNADGTVRPGERLQLWSHDHVDVEVSGSTYPINPNNYQAFTADDNGQLTVVFAATDLDVPPLSAWAGFMHRDERFTIPLDQEANGKLADVNGDKLAKPQRTNWKPGYDPGKDDKAVVKEGYVQHAEKVATAIRHVMSVSQEPAKPKTLITPRSMRVAELMARRNFADMRQAALIPAGDTVRPLRTLRHINRRAPADLESFRQALDKVPEFKGSVGFSFEKTATDFVLKPLSSLEHVKREFPRAFAAPAADPEPLGNIFDDAWNAIENAAEAAWEAAKKVAVFIADQVTLVIDFADQTVKKVVNSVKEAVDAVVHIIKMIEAAIEDVIRILMLLFDWSGILKTQGILKTITQNQLKLVKDMVSAEQKDKFQSRVAEVFNRKTGPMDLSKHEAAQVSVNSAREQHNDPRVQAQVNSVHGKYVDSKVDDHKDGITVSRDASPADPKNPVDDAVQANVEKLSESFGRLLSNPLGVEFGEIYDGIKDLIAGDISKFGTDLTKAFLSNHNVLADMVTAMETIINADADIPFLSQLYKWITGGHTLTLLDVTCLALAIPTHVGYGIFTLIACDQVRDFSEDAAKLIGEGDHESLTHRDHNLALHWCYFAFNFMYIMGSSILKGLQVVKGPAWRLDKELKWIVPGWYVNGVVAKSLIFTANQKEAGWNDEETAWNSTLFGVLVVLDLYTIYDVWMGLEPTRETKTAKFVQLVKGIASLVGVVLLGIRLDIWINHKSDIAPLFHVRGLLEALTMMLSFDDTRVFIDRVGRKTAGYFVLAETDLKFATIAVHIAGIVIEVKGTLPPRELSA